MQRPVQGAQPAAIELGPVDRPELDGLPTGPATSVAEAERPGPPAEPPHLLPPPPWLARELERPEPVTPAVPFFDRETSGPDGPAEEPPARRGPRRFPFVLAGILALFLVAALVGAGVVNAMGGGSTGAGPAGPGPVSDGAPASGTDSDDTAGGGTGEAIGAPATERLVTGPVGDLRVAQFDLVSGTTTVNLRAGDLGDELYRVSTPIDADVQPRVITDGDRVELHLVPSGQPGPGVVDIELNSTVRWQLRLTGGVAQHTIDLTGTDLDWVDITGGAARIDLTLPPPQDTVRVRMTGGANQFLISAPDGPPARVRFGAGAGGAIIDGRNHGGIAPGTVFNGQGWSGATDRYDMDVVAGLSVFTLQRG